MKLGLSLSLVNQGGGGAVVEKYIRIPVPAASNGNRTDTSGAPNANSFTNSVVLVDFRIPTLGDISLAGYANVMHPYISAGNMRVLARTTTSGGSFLNFGAHGISANQRTLLRFSRTDSSGAIAGERSFDGGDSWVAFPNSPVTLGAGEPLFSATSIRGGYGVNTPTADLHLFSFAVNGVKYIDPTNGLVVNGATTTLTAQDPGDGEGTSIEDEI